MLYVPLGFFFCLTGDRKRAWAARLGVAVLCGFVLSLAVELTQYYDSDRDTEATDLYANTLGTLIGAIPALFNPTLVWGTSFRLKNAMRIPLLLLAAWLSYKLYPFVPVIGLHKYWHAVEPLLTQQIPAADLFRHFATWTLAAIAVRFIVMRRLWYGALFGFVMLGENFVSGGVLSLAEIARRLGRAGSHAGGALSSLLAITGTLLLTADIVLFRLMPFERWRCRETLAGFLAEPDARLGDRRHVVVPGEILSLWRPDLAAQGMWHAAQTGQRVTAAILLFAASWAERYLPDRSAEITDALLALVIGVGFALLEDGKTKEPAKPRSASPNLSRYRRR